MAAAALAGCGGKAKKGESIAPPKGVNTPGVVQLTKAGENRRPRFAGSDEIVFVSRKRLNHNHWQAYSYKLRGQEERRLTFQDGEVFDVAWWNTKRRYIYSSTTDEIKELSPADRQANREKPAAEIHSTAELRPPTEIYLADDLGEDIDRVTYSREFDGDVDGHPKSQELAYVSVRGGVPQVYSGNFKSAGRRLTANTQAEWSPRYSPKATHILWTTKVSDKASEIRMRELGGKKTESVIVGGDFLNVDPAWHPNGDDVVFASNREDGNLELFIVRKDGTCLRRLTYHSGSDREPSLSADGSKLVFASDRDGAWHIYEYTSPLPPCP